MNAKTELAKRLSETFSGGMPVTAEALAAILKDYSITKESDEQRSDLHRRIKYYLGAKRIDGLSDKTLGNYRCNLEMFAARVNKSAAKVTTDDIRGYISYLDETRHLKDTSLQTHINTLRAFFGWLHTEERIKKNPMAKIKSLKLDGRSSEIQRLIGRALRAVVDREALGERQITIDCDVIQADGGTRCASITGGFVALWLACKKLLADGVIEKMPLTAQVAAVSVGIFEDEAVLDLNYAEDSHAIVDCNVVMTSKGEFIEVQGTGEGRPFTDTELRKLLGLGKRGCLTLCRKQAKVMGESL